MLLKVAIAAAALASVALAVTASPHAARHHHRHSGAHPRVAARHRRHGFMAPPKDVSSSSAPLPDQWLTQTLDHFDPTNNATWSQRYFVNDQYYVAGGPVFLMLGGEGTANPMWLTAPTQMVNWAQHFGALMFLIEHRYYGVSQPFPDLSTPNLRFLSSEQALADAAVFHDAMVTAYDLPANTPWVSFGGSYSGALSAWLRLKYPHVVAGAVASSAPLTAELDFSQYLDVVTTSLTTMGSSSCVSNVAAATAAVTNLLGTASGRAQLSSLFQTCTPLTADPKDVANFVSTLAGNFENVVQYNGDNRAFEGATDGNVTVAVLCALMDDTAVASPLQRYANVNSLILQTYGEPCVDYAYADFIASMQNTTLTAALSGGRQWQYQTCTEFGWYQSSDSPKQPFGSGFGLDFWVQQCADIYGPAFSEAEIARGIAWTASNYGGSAGYGGSNVVFPNGLVDPWHDRGVLQSLSPTVTAVVIDGTAHCADMYPSAANDPAPLANARATIFAQLQAFVGQTKAQKAADADTHKSAFAHARRHHKH